jgi:hypothetical protein
MSPFFAAICCPFRVVFQTTDSSTEQINNKEKQTDKHTQETTKLTKKNRTEKHK